MTPIEVTMWGSSGRPNDGTIDAFGRLLARGQRLQPGLEQRDSLAVDDRDADLRHEGLIARGGVDAAEEHRLLRLAGHQDLRPGDAKVAVVG